MQLLMVAITFPYAIACYFLYSLVSNFLISRRNAAKARELNCEEPAIQKNRYPFGIDNLLRALAADRAKLYPVDMIKRAEDVGSYTYRHTILGRRTLHLVVLSTKLKILILNRLGKLPNS